MILATSAVPVFFDNLSPMMDTTGSIMDAHDQSIRKSGDYYYRHAVAYGPCKEPVNHGCDTTSDHCGFQQNHTVNVWRSKTLASGSWEFLGEAMPVSSRPPGVLFRPDAILNPLTNLWVLYWNYVYPSGTYAGCAAATSATPEGPFALQRELVNTTFKGGDFHLFTDPKDNAGYIIYGASYKVTIEKLTPDYLSTQGGASASLYTFNDTFDYFSESPMLLEKNGIYYALFSWCCCYCLQGSGIIVHTAPSMAGPWTRQEGDNIACTAGTPYVPPSHSSSPKKYSLSAFTVDVEPTNGQGCQYHNASTTATTRAQQNFVVSVDTPTGVDWIWIGDRWQQSWDGTKGHDPQTFLPLPVNANGSISFLAWQDNFTMDVI
jgi:Glycosyl hydrolases family 43